jgi:ATP-dependent protease ClpP protease subunit
MTDDDASIAGEPPPALVPIPEPGANASGATETAPLPPNHVARPATDVSNIRTSRPNYIVRHWRGELSLPVSYWINAFLATIVASFVFQKLVSIISISESPLVFATTRTLVLVAAIAISIWQLVGVWRSAGKRRERGGRFWAGVARFLVVIGFLGHGGTLAREAVPQLTQLAEIWSIAFGDPGVGKHTARVLSNRSEIEFVGGITFGVTDEIRKLLDAAPNVREIQLNSPGGRIGEAHKLRELIRERGLVTYVDSTCASACTVAFLGGSQRYLAPGARLGFHRGSIAGVSAEQLDRENDADRQWLVAIGVPRWFADHAYSTPSSSMWWPTPAELLQAGIITAEIGRPNGTKEVVAAGQGLQKPLVLPNSPSSALNTTASKESIDKELQNTSLYVAIKRTDPEAYDRILAAVSAAIRSGKSKDEVAALPQPFVYAVLRRHKAHASDQAVLALAELTVAEIEAIGRKDMNACYVFLFAGSADRPSFWEYLPPDILERRFAGISDLIETGVTSSTRIPPSREVSRLREGAIEAVARRYSEKFPLALADPRSPKFSHETVCQAFAALFREALSLPPTDQIQLLRFLLGRGSIS